MALFDKEKLTKLANKTLEGSKKVAQLAAEKTNEAIEKQKNKNKNFYTPINGSIHSKIVKYTIVGEYYNKENIESLGNLDEQFKLNKTQLMKQNLYGWKIYEYDFSNDYEVTLEFEPKNQYDPNAIMVLLNGLKVGYIAREETLEIKNLMKLGIVGIDVKINGCRTKTLLHSKYEPKGYVETTDKEYSIELFIALK